jgi:hypothetical protein
MLEIAIALIVGFALGYSRVGFPPQAPSGERESDVAFNCEFAGKMLLRSAR